MADESKKLSGSETVAAARQEKLAPQLWMMITTFFHSPGRNTLFLLGAALCAVVALTAFGQIKLNAWGISCSTIRCQDRSKARSDGGHPHECAGQGSLRFHQRRRGETHALARAIDQ